MFSKSSAVSSTSTTTGFTCGGIPWVALGPTILSKYPDLWAGLGVAAPAPSAPPEQLEAFKHVPIIVLQGDQDPLVTRTREWVAKMKAIGMEHVYIEVKGGDHSRFINASADTLGKIFAFFNIVRKDQRPETD